MSRASAPSAIEIFDAASRIPRERREEFLRGACAGDPRLIQEVQSLLKSLDGATGFLDKSLFGLPIVEPKTPTPARNRAPTGASVSDVLGAMAGRVPAGKVIGRYTVERVLGEGGMGVVYLAQQETPRRAVALKVIRPAVATPTMMRRFTLEAELLGRLQHPGIAQIFEAGTADLGVGDGGGIVQPFLAMELVRGEPITDHARSHDVSLRGRLELVAKLCDAVEHAHQRGLIHRDLKPANILVDEGGQPKILDFGVARAVDSPAPGATLATEVGTLIGTLAYMSPEQVGGDSATVDTRSDIYGIGVILYELVCGKRPHDTEDLGLFEAAKQVREREPVRPSAIRKDLRGDVDTIVMKAMAKDRDRRYASAGALREDLRRHLAGEPILARQDSALYVLRKTIRRHRGPVAALLLSIVALAAFGVYAKVQSGREHQARLKAENEKHRADQTALRLEDELYVSNVSRARWLMDNGPFLTAEDTLWREHLTHPDSAQSWWALRDLYSRYPSLVSMPTENRNGRTLAMSKDGTLAAMGDTGGTVSLWRTADGLRLGSVKAAPEASWGAAIDPAKKGLATVGDDGILRIWNIAEPGAPGLVAESLAHLRGGYSLATSPDGGMLATVGNDRSVAVFDGHSGVRLRTLLPANNDPARFLAVAFDDTGTRIAFGGDGGGLYWADLSNPSNKIAKFGDTQSDIQSVAFSHDGSRLLAGTGGALHSLQIWDIAAQKQIKRISSNNGTVRNIDLSPDDRLALITGYWRSDILDLETGAAVFDTLSRPRGTFRARFLPGMDRVLTTGGSESRVWELTPKPKVADVQAHRGYIGKLSVSADGSRILTVSSDGSAALWDTRTWTRISRVPRSRAFYSWVGAVSADGSMMAVVAKTGLARLYRATDGQLLAELKGLSDTSADCVFTEDGQRLVGASNDGRVVVWNTRDFSLERTLARPSRELFRLLRVQGNLVAAAQRGSNLHIWDAATGNVVREIPVTGSSWCIAVSPDRSCLAIGFFHGEVEIWDLKTDKPQVTIDAHTQMVMHLAFTSDGRALATTARDGAPKLWDAKTGLFLTRLGETKPAAAPANLAFLPNSPVFVEAFDDGHFEAWDTSYFDRHIAGNLEHQMRRHAATLGARLDADKVNAWAATLRNPGARSSAPEKP